MIIQAVRARSVNLHNLSDIVIVSPDRWIGCSGSHMVLIIMCGLLIDVNDPGFLL